ncbi:MAG: hypothetical protein GY847_37610 [Proteobacteria bacterium]|nr:hypothetical protein [Pseudomonadota bacterium]
MCRFYLKLSAVFVFIVLLAMPAGQASAESERAREECPQGSCLFIEHDDILIDEARSLVETLRLRLCKRGVQVLLKSSPTLVESEPDEDALAEDELDDDESVESRLANGNECPELEPSDRNVEPVWWVAHLRVLSDAYILVAVDHLGAQSDEDLIREMPRGLDAGATAWTAALIIEEALRPYLNQKEELAPLGAGLAIIEPPAVGGIKKTHSHERPVYPTLRCLGVGLTIIYLGAIHEGMSDFIVGPRIGVQGLLGPRFVALFSAGWVGTGEFSKEEGENGSPGVNGSISHVPFDLLFGYIPFFRPRIGMGVFAGISTGFVVFKTLISERNHIDVLFDPWIQFRIELTFPIYGPLAAYINGGTAITIRQDRLELANYGDEVYYQDWIMPIINVGLQLWFWKTGEPNFD